MQICQIFFQQVCGDGQRYCSDKYQHSRDIQPSLMYREFGRSVDETQLELNFGEPVRSRGGDPVAGDSS